VLYARRMKNLSIPFLLAGALLTSACGKKTASVDDMQKLKDEACACKDKKCADAVSKKADDIMTDDAIKAGGDKAMGLVFDIAGCLAAYDSDSAPGQ
jgi:hypothetical protein